MWQRHGGVKVRDGRTSTARCGILRRATCSGEPSVAVPPARRARRPHRGRPRQLVGDASSARVRVAMRWPIQASARRTASVTGSPSAGHGPTRRARFRVRTRVSTVRSSPSSRPRRRGVVRSPRAFATASRRDWVRISKTCASTPIVALRVSPSGSTRARSRTAARCSSDRGPTIRRASTGSACSRTRSCTPRSSRVRRSSSATRTRPPRRARSGALKRRSPRCSMRCAPQRSGRRRRRVAARPDDGRPAGPPS